MNKYNATSNKTEDGRVIYHLDTGKRGRPVQYVKQGDKYVRLHEKAKAKAAPKAKKVKAEKAPVAAPATEPVAPAPATEPTTTA